MYDPTRNAFAGGAASQAFPLSAALQAGGMQSLGVRGGLAGLQAAAAGQQQVAGGRFTAQTLQSNIQQLNQFQARQGALGNAGLANGVLTGTAAAAAAAGVRASGLGGLPLAMGANPTLAAIRPAVDRAANAAAANLGISNLAAASQQVAGMQGYNQNALAAALGTQGINLGINRLANAAAGIGGLQNLQNARLGLNAGGNAGNLLQQGMATSSAQGINPSQDLLAIIGRQKPMGGGGPFNAAQLGGLGVSAGFNAGVNNQGLASVVGGQGGLQQGGQQDGEGPAFDTSDFPSLGGAGRQQAGAGALGMGGAGGGGGHNPYDALGLRKAAAAVAGGSAAEFSMQSEDFPALPGTTQRVDGGQGYGGGAGGQGGRGGFPQLLAAGGQEDVQRYLAQAGEMSQEQYLQLQRLAAEKGMVLPKTDAGQQQQDQLKRLMEQKGLGGMQQPAKPPGPGAAMENKYGLLGLMPLLRLNDPDLTMLALGTDLTSLGLNLNSSENLHKHFVSTLSDTPIKPEPEYELPSCYRHQPQRLQPGYLTKFKEETLFYMFYSMPQDEAQLIAADELSSRGWWFHKRHRLWIIRAPNASTPAQKSSVGERGAFLVFDPAVWEVVQRPDLEVVYEDIERPPSLPRPKTLQPVRH